VQFRTRKTSVSRVADLAPKEKHHVPILWRRRKF